MKFTFLSVLLFAWMLVSCTTPPVVEYQVIPEPQSVNYKPGILKWGKNITLAHSEELTKEASLLKENLARNLGLQVELISDVNKKADIRLVLKEELKVEVDSGEGMKESKDPYTLEVGSKGVVIMAKSPASAFYATQTLRQIIRQQDEKYIVQKGVISDGPMFIWRSFLLDEGRYFKGKAVVKQLLDEMALLKMNVFQWHLTDDQGWRIEIKKYPKLTEIGAYRDSSEINHFHSEVYDGKPHGGFYTQDEIKEIVAYATDRHILVVPEIEMPGHASAAIAAYSWLGTSGKQINVPCRFGVQYDVFNVTDPKVLTFFNDVIDEVITLFPSPVFHIGGDEVRYNQWSASPMVKAYMAKHGIKTPAELQVFFTNNISNLLVSKGKRMMGWNEITGAKLHEYQSDADTKGGDQKLAEGTIVQFWKGDSALIVNTAKNGYDIVNSYHASTYLDYKNITLEKAYSFSPVPVGLPKELEPKILGFGCQMWGEFTPTAESMNKLVYPRIAAYAECGWTYPDKKNFERFEKALPYFLNRWTNERIVFGTVK